MSRLSKRSSPQESAEKACLTRCSPPKRVAAELADRQRKPRALAFFCVRLHVLRNGMPAEKRVAPKCAPVVAISLCEVPSVSCSKIGQSAD
jgi:hypothetical protein